MYFVYMIKNKHDNLYTGITNNPTQRLHSHNSKRGALFTKERDMFEIVFLEKYELLSQARKREIQIKKWPREKKDFLIQKYENGLETKMSS